MRRRYAKRSKRFTKSQLDKLRANQTSEENRSQNHPEGRNKKSSTKNVEQDADLFLERQIACQKNGKISIQKGIRYRLIIHSYRSRLIDASNAYFKAIEDCLVTLNVFPDDSPEYCDQPLFLQTKVKKSEEKTVVEVLSYKV